MFNDLMVLERVAGDLAMVADEFADPAKKVVMLQDAVALRRIAHMMKALIRDTGGYLVPGDQMRMSVAMIEDIKAQPAAETATVIVALIDGADFAGVKTVFLRRLYDCADTARECRVCHFTASGQYLAVLMQHGNHPDGNGDTKPNDGIAFCPRCKDETLILCAEPVGDQMGVVQVAIQLEPEVRKTLEHEITKAGE